MFWDTMGVGCGNHEDVDTDSGIIRLNINGFREWYDIYDRHEPIDNFSDYWKIGWNHALKVRRYLPAHIDLYYMCYDPSRPDDYLDYNCKYPKVLVPHTREILKDFPTIETKSMKEWQDKRMSAARDYVFGQTTNLLAYEEGIAYARDSFLAGAEKAKEAASGNEKGTLSNKTLDLYKKSLGIKLNSELCEIVNDAFLSGFQWHLDFGQHLFMDIDATLMLESQNVTIKNAEPESQWSNSPGNAPTPGLGGTYKFFFHQNDTSIKVGDRVILHPHENVGWEKFVPLRVTEISETHIVVDTGWAVLNKCSCWDIELVEVSK